MQKEVKQINTKFTDLIPETYIYQIEKLFKGLY